MPDDEDVARARFILNVVFVLGLLVGGLTGLVCGAVIWGG